MGWKQLQVSFWPAVTVGGILYSHSRYSGNFTSKFEIKSTGHFHTNPLKFYFSLISLLGKTHFEKARSFKTKRVQNLYCTPFGFLETNDMKKSLWWSQLWVLLLVLCVNCLGCHTIVMRKQFKVAYMCKLFRVAYMQNMPCAVSAEHRSVSFLFYTDIYSTPMLTVHFPCCLFKTKHIISSSLFLLLVVVWECVKLVCTIKTKFFSFFLSCELVKARLFWVCAISEDVHGHFKHWFVCCFVRVH